MNFYINKHKWKNANKLRQIHSTIPKEYLRFLNCLTKIIPVKKKKKKKTSLQDFYDYFRIANTSETNEELAFEQSGYDSEKSDQILNIKIS